MKLQYGVSLQSKIYWIEMKLETHIVHTRRNVFFDVDCQSQIIQQNLINPLMFIEASQRNDLSVRYGTGVSLGHMDFYPDGGQKQEGCRVVSQSHLGVTHNRRK